MQRMCSCRHARGVLPSLAGPDASSRASQRCLLSLWDTRQEAPGKFTICLLILPHDLSSSMTKLEETSLAAELETHLRFETSLAKTLARLSSLAGMREGVPREVGNLDIERVPGRSTTVLAWVPTWPT